MIATVLQTATNSYMWTWCTLRLSVLIALIAKITVFWDITQCRFMDLGKPVISEFRALRVPHTIKTEATALSTEFILIYKTTRHHGTFSFHSVDVEVGRSSRTYNPWKVMTVPSAESVKLC
jgi:hypothetical protein